MKFGTVIVLTLVAFSAFFLYNNPRFEIDSVKDIPDKIRDTDFQNIITANPDEGSVGSLNHEYLQDTHKVIIEIDYIQGSQLKSSTTTKISNIFNEVSGKNVKFSGGNIIQSTGPYSLSQIKSLEKENRNNYSDDDTVVLYILSLDGEYEESNVLGVTYSASSIALFPDSMDDASTALITYSQIEKAVTIHELGHVFGLVNIGYSSEKDHEDSSHSGHSNNQNSVMYWAVDDISISNVFNLGPPTEFDSDDLFDLEMIRKGIY